MALLRLNPDAVRRVMKRRARNEKRARKMENAIRRSLYIRPLADLGGKIVEAAGRVFSRR